MFERFTDRARRAVVLAQEEARVMKHDYIGTEHILLGLLAEGEGVAAKALEELGVDLETLRVRVEGLIGAGIRAPDKHIAFTPRAKETLELSLKEALKLGHNYIGTEHILLGLIEEGSGVAAQVLVAAGVDASTVRAKVIELLSGITAQSTGRRRSPVAPPSPSSTDARETPALSAALARARALAADDLVGTHHVLAAFVEADDASAHAILAAGGFDATSLPTDISLWDVTGTGDEDPITRAARGTVVIQDADGLTVRLDDENLQQRIRDALASGRLSSDNLREALGRVWTEFAGAGEPAAHDEGDEAEGPETEGPETGG